MPIDIEAFEELEVPGNAERMRRFCYETDRFRIPEPIDHECQLRHC